jgi:hypothetical protein
MCLVDLNAAIGDWHTIQKARPKTAPARCRTDYVKFNKIALERGLVTTREQQALRETIEVLRVETKRQVNLEDPNTARLRAMTHGVVSRLATLDKAPF